MDKNLSTKVLSDITVFSKYSKYLEESETRESWGQICDRYENMMKGKYPGITGDIVSHMQNVRDKKLLPSMRAMQFAGPAIARNHSRIYNCAYLPLNDYRSFSEAMFLLLGGTGVGYSVQFHHVEQLPTITKPVKERKYVVADSIEGWADAVKALMKSYYGMTTSKPRFDFGDIREKGARLVTAGGKAPGPEPLKECLFKVEQILDRKSQGEKLTTVECHDIMCHIANAVLAGGIRRAAMISLFSFDDTAMATCKYGNWWEQNEQRGRANNSSVILRHKVTKSEFMDLWKRIEASGSGEPGVYFSNDKDWGTNPSLRAGTKVLTTEGIFPIEELQDKTFKVKNLNGEISDAKCWLSGKDQKLWKLTLKDGSEYYSTKEHEWPVWDGDRYVKVNTPNIKAGSKLPFLRETKLFDGTLGNYNDGFLSGWIIGDGWVSNRYDYSEYGMIVSDLDDESNVSKLLIDTITHNVPDFKGSFKRRYRNVFEDFEEEAQVRLMDSGTKEISINNKKFDKYIKAFGVVDKNVGLPKAVWAEGSENYRKGLIDGLFSSDGHVEKNKKRITLTSSRRKLIDDVSELLGFYGIKTTIKSSTTKLDNKEYVRYDLRINENQSIKQFMSLFTLSVKHKQEELDSYKFKNTKDNNQVEVLFVEETNLNEDVWDISVHDETHCFQLSKVVTGNCCEIALKPYQFCNLTEVNVSDVQNQEELEARIGSASFFGTLQAGFSDFHYLRDIWKRTTDKDALVGVGMTGIGSGKVLDLDLEKAAQVAKDVNSEVAALIGINEASRVTTVKPSGTTSCVLGTSSGIHAWYNDYYVRRIRLGKNESLCTYLTINHPELIEDDFFRPNDQSVVSIPQKAPEGSILRTETAVELLERVKKFNLEWVKAGHRKGNNTNNVSATISIDKQRLYDGSKLVSDSNSEKMLGGLKDEWEVVGEWMWKHRETYNGISVLPYDGGTYKQAPFEDITKEQYDNMIETLKDVDLSKVIELDDNTDFGQAPACSSGKCEI